MTQHSIGHHIAGEVTTGSSSQTLTVTDPATGEATGALAVATAVEVDAAVAAARTAQQSWAQVPVPTRAKLFFRYRALLESHLDELAALITAEHGKTLDDARGEVRRGIEVVEFACGIPQLLKGDHSQQVGPGIDSYSLRQPLGVAVGITPFNFPAMVPLWMFPVALACGNGFVLKPSERDPSVSLELARLLVEAGAPPGLLNVVQGDRTTVEALLDHPDVASVSFVGSTAVAEQVHRTATLNGKRVQALGGAKNHAVVMPDADLDHAATSLLGAAYGSAGERCMAVSVVVVVGEPTADALVDRLASLVEGLRLGPGTADGVDMGPLISTEHRDRVSGYIEAGLAEGADLSVDGRKVETGAGFFLGGSLFDRVTPQMSIYRDEIFGPVLSVVRVDTFEAAVRLVNEHEYGNGTVVFTGDGRTAQRFVDEVTVGMVGINVPLPVPSAFHSFGGWKRSMFGDHHVYGPEGVRFYTRQKTAMVRWPEGSASVAAFSMPTHS